MVPIADCLPGFQHPIGHPELCVPIDPPAEVAPIPTLSTENILGLIFVIAAFAIKYWRRT